MDSVADSASKEAGYGDRAPAGTATTSDSSGVLFHRVKGALDQIAQLEKTAAVDEFNLNILKQAIMMMAGAVLAVGDPKVAMLWAVAKGWVDTQEKLLKKAMESRTAPQEFQYQSDIPGPTETFPYMASVDKRTA